MQGDLVLWLGLVSTGALWIVIHLRALGRVLRSPGWLWWQRLAGLLPPILPWLAWRSGARLLTLLWLITGAAYASLWLVEAST